ncbi:MAG: SMC family ATPase [Firmicutes bacterium]|nr:SMC family ATPase [Bacillota bacterium]
MKPIRLIFSGLNSYRTQQVVDFETLGADGLFGIFGPTGSGKSSILDAITLALYGGVDRASNNTRGIIHQLEKTLAVSFEYELGGDRYLVERLYNRNPKDPDAAVAKQARLRMLTLEGEAVLASKPQEVTAKVEAILGIGKDEFSRAVVLPQGKFDQFLRLTGGDRAAMLEHLFNLEQYGEGLVAKVKNEGAICTELLQRIEGEEQGLGDCSETAIHQAASDLQALNAQFASAQQNFEAADKSYKEADGVRELFLKRKNALEKLTQLEQERETITAKQSRLSAAEQAEPLRELIARHKDLTKKIAVESISYQKQNDSHVVAVGEHAAADEKLKKAEKEYQEQLPQLQERKVQYQEAQEKQKKLTGIGLNLGEKQRELGVLGGKITEAAQEIAAAKKVSDDTQAAWDGLQQERAKLIVDPQEKEAVEKALTVLVNLEGIEKRCRESQDLYQKRKLQNEARWAAIIEKVHQLAPDQPVAFDDDLEQYAKSILYQGEQDLDQARQAQQQALLANSAAELVKELHDGEPCPVCGSREHPLPAKAAAEMGQIEDEIKAAEERLRQVRDWEGQLLKLWHDWSSNQTLVNEDREQLEAAEKELQVISAEFEKVWEGSDGERLRNRKQEFTSFEKQLHLIDQKREQLQKIQGELREKLQQLNDSLQDYKIQEASVQSDLINSQSQLGEITKELNRITGGQDLDGLIRELVQTYEQLDKAVKDSKGREGETRAVMDKLAREVAALDATLKANREELAKVEARLAAGLKEAGFAALAEAETVLMETAEREFIRQQLEQYRQEVAVARSESDRLDREINNRPFDEKLYEELKALREELFQVVERFKTERAFAKSRAEELQKKQERWNELQKQKAAVEQRKGLAEELGGLLRGRKFVSFLAQEHLRDMTLEASYQLGRLTGQRYALELAKDKDCEFVIRDDYNGGQRRMINSLSGGEVFMASLALALALSSKIQLRGKYPLGFFFLDEGFGSLDQEKLDKVMNALEKLHNRDRMVGVISHVREMKERLPRYLEVVAAGEDGRGSRIK